MDVESIAETGAKVAVKVGLNVLVPGLGTAVDFYEAAKDFNNEEYLSAAMNFVSGVVDLFLLGLWSGSKDLAKGFGKSAAINAAKTEATVVTKDLSKEAGKKIKKEIGKKLSKELAKGMLDETVEHVMYGLTKRNITDIILKGSFEGIVEGGGMDVIKKAIFTNILNDTLEEAVKAAPKGVVTSMTASAAESAVQKFLLETSTTACDIKMARTFFNIICKNTCI